ncbi:MAG: M28 family peptidase, partial [Bacteroidia bacterium]
MQLKAQKNAIMPGLTEDYFRFVINRLAHDSMKGREVGTPQEKSSAVFIAAELKRAGCKFIRKKPFQPFEYNGPDSVMINSSGNVIGRIDTRSKYSIVVSAHYDHIGNGKHHSKAPFSLQIHNGADDNSSGVA